MKITQYDVRKGNKIETVLVVPFNTEKNITEIAEKHLAEADEVIVTIWKYGKKVDTQSFVKEVEVEVEVEVKEEIPAVKTSVEVKETSKGTEYIYKVTVGEKEFTRKSKRKFTHAAIVKHKGEWFVDSYNGSKDLAQKSINAWIHKIESLIVEL